MKYPYFKYTFIRCFLFFLMFYKFYQISWAYYYFQSFNLIYCIIYIVIAAFVMKLGCKQHLLTLKKYEKILNKALDAKNKSCLKETGYVAEAGSLCLWIDLH